MKVIIGLLQYCDFLDKKILAAAQFRVNIFEKGVEQVFVLFPDFGVDAVADAGAFYGSLDDAGIFQLFEVLGNGGLGEAEFFDQAAADAGVFFHEVLQDGDAGRVGNSLGHDGDVVLLFGEKGCLCGAHDLILLLQYYD